MRQFSITRLVVLAPLDTSSVTGESMPMEAGVGANVTSGPVSLGGYLEIRAEQVSADTTFSRLIHLVAEAASRNPNTDEAKPSSTKGAAANSRADGKT